MIVVVSSLVLTVKAVSSKVHPVRLAIHVLKDQSLISVILDGTHFFGFAHSKIYVNCIILLSV